MAKVDWLDGYDPVAEGEQAEDGTDLIGIQHNLTLSLLERIEQHRCAVESVLWLKRLQRVSGPTPNRSAP